VPFLNLRQVALDYHGLDQDLTGLTEYRIGWFGPTNVNDPLTGDLWWAANFAVREANAQTGCPSDSQLSTSSPPLPPHPALGRGPVGHWRLATHPHDLRRAGSGGAWLG
jgi:hypothetical protein